MPKRLLSAVAAALVLAATPAAAQMIGNPVYYSPKHGTGLSILGDFAKGLNDASAKTTYFGGRAILGLPIVTVSAGAGIVKPDDALVPGAESEVTFGGNVSFNVLSAPLLPVAVALQAGAGFMSQGGGNVLHVPIGAVIALSPPSPGLNIEAWVAPRLDLVRTSNGTSSTETNPAVSLGVNLSLPTGIGLHAALDYTLVSSDIAGVSSSDISPMIFGVGLHYKFTIPGLGMVGM